ncbi:hypothetical protein SCUP515_09053 [Seiridium cupressi]
MKLNFAIIAAAAFGISVMGAAIPEQVFHAPKSFTPAKNTDVPLNKKVEEPSDVVREVMDGNMGRNPYIEVLREDDDEGRKLPSAAVKA